MHLPLLLSVTALLATSITGAPHAINLEERQAPPPPNTCPANRPMGFQHLWVERSDPIINIDVGVSMRGGMTGHFGLTVDLDQGSAVPDSSHLMAEGVDISPHFEAGSYVESQVGDTTTYQIWVNSIRQTTPDMARNGIDYQFPGVFPRVDMVIRRDPRTRYDEVSWQNLRQNAAAVFLVGLPHGRCG